MAPAGNADTGDKVQPRRQDEFLCESCFLVKPRFATRRRRQPLTATIASEQVSTAATCGSCRSVLPAEARFCPACGAPVSPTDAPSERRVVTVLFADSSPGSPGSPTAATPRR